MKNVIFKTNEAVANCSGAMEADTISNGRSLKSHKSREKFFIKICGALLAAVVVMGSCDKDDDNDKETDNDKVKLVETISRYEEGYDEGNYDKYEYDSQNRITKVTWYGDGKIEGTETFTYSGNDLTKIVISYSNDNPPYTTTFTKGSGNTITIDPEDKDYIKTLTLNSNGYLIKDEFSSEHGSGYIEFEYDNFGNVIRHTNIETWGDESYQSSCDFKYDNKNAPFRHCKTPKWYFVWAFDNKAEVGIHNNATEMIYDDGYKRTYSYIYDSDGYPTKETAKYEDDDDGEGDVWMFTYISK